MTAFIFFDLLLLPCLLVVHHCDFGELGLDGVGISAVFGCISPSLDGHGETTHDGIGPQT